MNSDHRVIWITECCTKIYLRILFEVIIECLFRSPWQQCCLTTEDRVSLASSRFHEPISLTLRSISGDKRNETCDPFFLGGARRLYMHIWVVVSNIFYFHLYLGKISKLTNIFQMGWNHQLDIRCVHKIICTKYTLLNAFMYTLSLSLLFFEYRHI